MKTTHLKARSSLMAALLFLATVTSACAQEKPKRMIPGPSVKELLPESPSENQDGISQIIFGQLFKPGPTEYAHVGARALKDAPPLPTGFVLFKDLVFCVKTEAIISGDQLTVFKVSSAENETDFRRLEVLHLEEDEMSPAGHSWTPVTVVPGGWDDYFHFVSKEQYEAAQPEFQSRRLASVTRDFGTFLIALAPAFETPSNGPFTQIEVIPSSSPEPVAVGEEVTHTIVVKNKGPKGAAELNLKVDLDAFFGYKGSSTQGACKRSDQSTGTILCYLGAMQPGSTAVITIVGRVVGQPVLTEGINERGSTLEVVFKANPTDLVEADNQVFMQFNFKILKKR